MAYAKAMPWRLVSLIFDKTTQDICSSVRRISGGVAVATARKSNTADVQIDKWFCLIINKTRH